METIADRLVKARIAAGYERAADAARAMGVPAPTYHGHENGHGGKRTREPFERYARFFHVNLEWLLTGKGEMRGGARQIPVYGIVRGSTAEIDETSPRAQEAQQEFIEFPSEGEIGALQVEGDSMRPRFMPGEFVLFELKPAARPADLLDQYVIAQTDDGRRMIKILRESRKNGHFRLESHWGDTIDVELLGLWRYMGSLPGSALIIPPRAAPARRKSGSSR